jgi:hypothetical protein
VICEQVEEKDGCIVLLNSIESQGISIREYLSVIPTFRPILKEALEAPSFEIDVNSWLEILNNHLPLVKNAMKLHLSSCMIAKFFVESNKITITSGVSEYSKGCKDVQTSVIDVDTYLKGELVRFPLDLEKITKELTVFKNCKMVGHCKDEKSPLLLHLIDSYRTVYYIRMPMREVFKEEDNSPTIET